MNQDQTNVLTTITSMTDAFMNADISGVMESYEPEAAIAFVPGQPISDTQLIQQQFEQWFALKPEFIYGEHEVIISGDIAVHSSPWRMTGTAPDGQAIEQEGLSVAVLKRQQNGSWRMVIDNPHGARLLAEMP